MILNMASGKVPMTYRGTNTVALFHFDEPHGSTTVTPAVGRGSATLTSGCSVTSSVYKWNGSLSMTYSSSTVRGLSYDDANCTIGTGPFTVEYFSRMALTSSSIPSFEISFDNTKTVETSPLTFRYNNSYSSGNGYITAWYIYQYGDTKLSQSSGLSFSISTFYHWAIVGDGGASGNRHIAWFFNGSRKFYVSIDYNLPGSLVTTFYTPTSTPSSYIYLDELRISNIARYSGESCPVPSAPFTPD